MLGPQRIINAPSRIEFSEALTSAAKSPNQEFPILLPNNLLALILFSRLKITHGSVHREHQRKMKLYSKKIGPAEYFGAMALVCFFFPYGWGVPKLWQVCLIFTFCAIYWLHKLVKKEEEALRAARRNDSRIVKVVLAFGTLMIANAVLVRVL